jgi:peptidoglycan hydrolase CwlO-like protein
LFGAAVLMALGTFIFGGDVLSYASTWGSSVRNAVKSEVPLEFEIERARTDVENLVPDIRDMMHVIASSQVDIEHKAAEVTKKETALETQKKSLLTLRDDLGSGKSRFVYASHSYTAEEVRKDLEKRFKQFKVAESSLKSNQQILSAWQKTLASNQEKLDTMLSAKLDLEVQLEQLHARLKSVEAAEATETFKFDDSRLARAKKLIVELNKQLDVREREANMEGQVNGLIPVEASAEPTDESIADRIDAYFGDTPENALAEEALADGR